MKIKRNKSEENDCYLKIYKAEKKKGVYRLAAAITYLTISLSLTFGGLVTMCVGMAKYPKTTSKADEIKAVLVDNLLTSYNNGELTQDELYKKTLEIGDMKDTEIAEYVVSNHNGLEGYTDWANAYINATDNADKMVIAGAGTIGVGATMLIGAGLVGGSNALSVIGNEKARIKTAEHSIKARSEKLAQSPNETIIEK